MKKTSLALLICAIFSFAAHAETMTAQEGVSYISIVVKMKPAQSLLRSAAPLTLDDSSLSVEPLFHDDRRLRSAQVDETAELNHRYGFDRYLRIALPEHKSSDANYINGVINKLKQQNPNIETIYPESLPVSLDNISGAGSMAEQSARSGSMSYSLNASPNGTAVPDFRALQDYLKAPDEKRPGYYMGGVNRSAVSQYKGSDGEGMTIVSAEINPWNASHVNLPPIDFNEGDKTYQNDDHDTSSVGIMAARDIGNGVRGLTWKSRMGYAKSPVNNLYNMIPRLKAGDVVQIGIQVRDSHATGCKEGCWVPMENMPAYYDVIKAMTDKGVYVIEAAGNGNINLDHPAFNGDYNVQKRDSGAIIAGAFCAKDGKKAYFSTYGSRVTSASWGCWDVVTTGYGNLYKAKNADYTDSFAGTSSANPIIAGVVASLGGIAKAHDINVSPLQMRTILQETGTPLAGGDSARIGTQPDMEKAVAKIFALKDGDTPPPPPLPVADAGKDFTVTGTTDAAKSYPLDASGSRNAASYSWTVGQGSGAFWLQSTQGGPWMRTVTGPKAWAAIPPNTDGKASYVLSVQGQNGEYARDTITITVKKAEQPGPKPMDDVAAYNPRSSYPTKCTPVSYNGKIWFSQWYINAGQETPGNGGQWGAWRLKDATNNACR